MTLARERVKKGFRLVLVYSICLPPTMRHLLRNHDKPLSEELAGLIGYLKPKADSFSLLLSHEYTDRSIQDLGTRALKGIDRARVEALEEANATLPAKKKMQFYIVAMEHDINYYDTGGAWEENERNERINWYSSGGQSYGEGMEEIKMNFLNPGRDSLAELWEGHGNSTFEGYLGNEGATRNTTYSRYAIVAWPAVRSVENALKYIGANAALGALKAQKSIDGATLRSFMTAAANANSVGDDESYSLGYRPKSESLSVKFCQTLCDLLVQVRDPALVDMFFGNFFGRLGDKQNLIPFIIKIIRAFKWSDIAKGLMGSLGGEIQETRVGFMRYAREAGDSGMKLALNLVQSLDGGPAQQDLLKAAVEKAVLIRDERLCSWTAVDVGYP
ncbi:hypothetical protein PF008_g20323 [Phytophthora fragariae]|uniref:Uncharacterized protein n=1 Tax=Phytophthora fragariae TaxID=53985 RepID=A0A6G0R030_9STRA|nr:hypothetical protein PF008_g20323 [Phytophthora fragariae]